MPPEAVIVIEPSFAPKQLILFDCILIVSGVVGCVRVTEIVLVGVLVGYCSVISACGK